MTAETKPNAFDLDSFWSAGEAEAKRLGWDTEETETNDETAETAEAAEAAVEGSGSEKADDEGNDQKENEGTVTPTERVAFRAEKRKWKARVESEKQAFEADKVRHRESLARFVEAQKLYEDGDVEAAIEKLTGDDFATVAQNVIKKAQGRDLKTEKKLARLEAERAEEKRLAEQQRVELEQRAHGEKMRAWAEENISKPLGADESTKPLLGIPGFVDMVFGIQWQAYNQDEEEVSLADATAQARARYEKIRESLNAALGGHPTSEDESGTATGQPGKVAAKGRRGRHIPKSRATSASRSNVPHFTDPNDPAFFDWFQKHMSTAQGD